MARKKTNPNQSSRFVEAARELETDDSPEAFERVFAKVVPPKEAGKAPPAPKPKTPDGS
jgi:hypothetical protein